MNVDPIPSLLGRLRLLEQHWVAIRSENRIGDPLDLVSEYRIVPANRAQPMPQGITAGARIGIPGITTSLYR